MLNRGGTPQRDGLGRLPARVFSKITPKFLEPLLHGRPRRRRRRHGPQRLQMPARPTPQAPCKMVRAIALAAQHTAVGVQEQLDRGIAMLTLEDAETIGAAFVLFELDLTPGSEP